MRRLFILGATLALLGGTVGCQTCGKSCESSCDTGCASSCDTGCGHGHSLFAKLFGGHTHGICDCDHGPQYGCPHVMGGHGGTTSHSHPATPETIKELPKELPKGK